jgi:hypothetical protein
MPSREIILKNADLLQIRMVKASAKYGVDSHVIEPRATAKKVILPAQ